MKKKLPLHLSHPHLEAIFHPTKNEELELRHLTAGMGKKVWWLCPEGHDYESAVYSISKNIKTTGCPYCAGKKVARELSLAGVFPEIAGEWHSTKNGSLTPSNVMPKTAKKVWWLCAKGHEYEARVANRTSLGRGCSVCASRKITDANSLLSRYPQIAAQLHPTKNRRLNPRKIAPGTHRVVWWVCSECKHEWKASIHNRARVKGSTGCPACANRVTTERNNLEVLNPELLHEWHPTLNEGLSPSDFVPGSNEKVWWRCKNGHEWSAKIADRARGKGCRKCTSQTSAPEIRLFTELVALFPDAEQRARVLGKEVDIYLPSLNLLIEYDGSYWHKNKQKKDVQKNLYFESRGYRLIRFRDNGLPLIRPDDISCPTNVITKANIDSLLVKFPELETHDGVNRYLAADGFSNEELYLEILSFLPDPHPTQSIAGCYPEVAALWDYKKNKPLKPENFKPGSELKLWWKCHCGREWQQDPYHLCIRGQSCTWCSHQEASPFYNFKTEYPALAEEWHPTKNAGSTPEDHLPRVDSKFWWICPLGDEYETSISNRVGGKGCPYCAGKKANQRNSVAALRPDLVAEWEPELNGGLLPTDFVTGSDQKITWKCAEGHTWDRSIYHRNKVKTIGCPVCRAKRH